MQKNSSAMFIAIIVLGIAGLVMVNKVQENNTPKTEAQMREEEEKKNTEAQKKAETGGNQADKTATGVTPEAAQGSPEDLVVQEGEMRFGDKDGKHELVMAYEWSPEIQNDPKQITAIMKQMKGMPNTRIRVVNADAEEVAPGLYMDGKLMTQNFLGKGATEEIFSRLRPVINQ
jgi:hypothetical protein